MVEQFDAYHKWLGIAPKDQPPNHYRLLGVDLFEADDDMREMLGAGFVSTYTAIKRAEFETFMEVISPWEREFLLLNV